MVDFDRINNTEDMRLSVGGVNVRTGQFTYFDNAEMTIRSEHIMASSALPPGFPPVEIDGEYYWDGGLFSNTPLEYVLDYSQHRSRLTFQVDLFNSRGQLPTNLDEVSERDKDIRYCSRTNVCSKAFRDRHDVVRVTPELAEHDPSRAIKLLAAIFPLGIFRRKPCGLPRGSHPFVRVIRTQNGGVQRLDCSVV